MAENNISVWLNLRNSKFKAQFEKKLHSVSGFKVQERRFKDHCELLIFELSDEMDKELQLVKVKEMLNSGEVREVFFVSDYADQAMLRTAIRIGAREFFSQPIADEEIVEALEKT